jgi:hypothetical protein
MSGFSKEEVQALVAAIPPSALPVEAVYLDSGAPITAEARKIYILLDLEEDLIITLPDAMNLTAGWAFEVFTPAGVDSEYNVQAVLAEQGGSNIWVGNGAPDDRPDLPVPMDMILQHYRFMATGPVNVPGFGLVGGWLVSRMNVPLMMETRLVEYATTAALPSYSTQDDQSKKLLKGASGALTVDGHVLSTGESVLVKDEAGSGRVHNGIYKVIQYSPWILRRRSDFCFSNQIINGANIVVLDGTVNAGRRFHIGVNFDIDSDNLIFGTSGDAAGAPDLLPTSLQTDEYAGNVRERVPYTPATFTGNKRITFPASPTVGAKFGITNVTNSTAIINAYSAAEKIQDPITGAVIAAATDVPIGQAYAGFVWQYMASATGSAWHLIG